MSKTMRKGLAPELRFSEFKATEPWIDTNFYELLDTVLDFRGRTPKKLGMDWGGGDIVSLSANNVKNGYIDFGAECNLGSEELYEKWMGDVSLDLGDIIFTMEAPLGNALLVPDAQKYILSQRVVAFKTKRRVINTFLIQLIWSEGFQSKINLLSTGSTAKGINQKTLKTISIPFPNKKEEQQKIAECLSSLDELIEAHTQKYKTLQSYKKGLLQNLFPAEGETVPALRFPEFEGARDWELKPLAKVAKNLDSKRAPITAQDRVKGDVPYYGASGVIDYVQGYIFDERLLCISEDGANLVARTYPIAFSISGKTWVNNHAHVLKFNDDCTHVMVENYLNSISLEDYLTGMAQPKLNRAKLDIIPIPIPSIDEQQKIADCLSSVNGLISVQAQKVEELKAHKKGLMQKLFPVVDEVDA